MTHGGHRGNRGGRKAAQCQQKQKETGARELPVALLHPAATFTPPCPCTERSRQQHGRACLPTKCLEKDGRSQLHTGPELAAADPPSHFLKTNATMLSPYGGVNAAEMCSPCLCRDPASLPEHTTNLREGPNSRGGFPLSRQTALSQKCKRPMGGERRRRRMHQRHHLDPLVALGTAQSRHHFPSRTRGPIHAPRLLPKDTRQGPVLPCAQQPCREAGPPSPPFPSISPSGTRGSGGLQPRAAGPTPIVCRLGHEQRQNLRPEAE